MTGPRSETETDTSLYNISATLGCINTLPTAERKALPAMEFTDCHINAVAKAYYADENFSRGDNPRD